VAREARMRSQEQAAAKEATRVAHEARMRSQEQAKAERVAARAREHEFVLSQHAAFRTLRASRRALHEGYNPAW